MRGGKGWGGCRDIRGCAWGMRDRVEGLDGFAFGKGRDVGLGTWKW
jgi:hypothetical protein